jgi:hypothetical protein
MDDSLENLIAHGYTAEEAELVQHVLRASAADRARARATGQCVCGRRMARLRHTLECVGCGIVHAA